MLKDKPVNSNFTIWKLPLLTSALYFAVIGGIFSVSPATSRNISRQYLAQAETEETTIPTDTEAAIPEESIVEEEEVAETEPDNSLEIAIISELNRVRTNPQGYADWLDSQKQYYQGMFLKLPGEQPIRTNRGLRSLEEAIIFLRQQNELSALSPSTELTSTAQEQIAAITSNQKVNNRNNLVYGKVTPEAIVMQLVVDDGFPDRRHRRAIFSQSLQDTGIACSEIPIYNNVCAIAFYPEDTTEIAQTPTETTPTTTTKPENQPETSATENSNQLPTPPNTNTPIASESTATETVETTNNNQTTSTTESEVIVPTQTPSETNAETTESEVIVSTNTESNNSTNPTVESEASSEVNSDHTSTSESEVTVTTETESDNSTNPTVESETLSESEATVTTETESNSPTTPNIESEVVPTPENSAENNSSTTESEIATSNESATESEIATNSQIPEIVEEGILEEGDEIIPNDGSFYDSYPLEGSAGDSFTITLESQDFDTFLAIMDQNGNIVEQNDDLNEEESNSRLEITLPDNGTYSVIVNAYDRGGKGRYVLKVSR
ncbi:putative membrane protein [Hyella patelloides LEGE 07179]|uniref:Putative membrane protein n=1 Tax=Hyella patelloides LEGE 07179 TaxID=945734 RepID=A0A563VIQ4_9CYAN|nr:pre-peptidase C-terminal domain-containing protein [Hyella patelloides]VEP11314.1 putative membrane protein [Hyella patelloides LEGE 07179]